LGGLVDRQHGAKGDLGIEQAGRRRAPGGKRFLDAALIIVAQRVSTIKHADQILVLDQGECVGLGTHRELLETCPTYAEIVESQMTAEEAA